MLSGGWVGQKKRGEVNLIPGQCVLEPQFKSTFVKE